MEVLWLKSQGLSHKQICKQSGVCNNAVTKYLRLYLHGGLDSVKKVNFYRIAEVIALKNLTKS